MKLQSGSLVTNSGFEVPDSLLLELMEARWELLGVFNIGSFGFVQKKYFKIKLDGRFFLC